MLRLTTRTVSSLTPFPSPLFSEDAWFYPSNMEKIYGRTINTDEREHYFKTTCTRTRNSGIGGSLSVTDVFVC